MENIKVLNNFRNTSVGSTAVSVKASSGIIVGYNIINKHTSDIFVKFYNIESGQVTPATNSPVLTLMVPASGSVYMEPYGIIHEFNVAISVRAVTGSADNDTTSPTTTPIIELKYTEF